MTRPLVRNAMLCACTALSFTLTAPLFGAPAEAATLVKVLDGPGSAEGVVYEVHRLRVRGVAADPAGVPTPDARVMAIATPSQGTGGFELAPVETVSDVDGEFALDVEVLVRRDPARPAGKQAEGEFCVYGVADGFGFTWSGRVFRPQPTSPCPPKSRRDQRAIS